MNRRMLCLTAATALVSFPARATQRARGILYKTPECSCCDTYAMYLRSNGFEIEVESTDDLAQISRQAGVPGDSQGCHTLLLDGYVVDGHVPIDVIRKLLAERPAIAGITLPGMPSGSPGMTGRQLEPFKVYAIPKAKAAELQVYAVK